MASANATFTDMVTTTYRSHKRNVVDNLSDHNALVRWMKDKGNIRTEDGGYEIALPIDYNENSNFMRYNGYDTLSVNATEALTAAKYDWCQSSIAVAASGKEMRMNSGEQRLINLAKAKVKNAIRTAANNMSVDIYSDGALTNQIGGLAHLITQDGTGTVGGIVAGTYTFWKNQFVDMTSPSATNIIGYMNQLFLQCVRGNDKPDLLVSSNDLYNYYLSALQANQRYASEKEAAAGFVRLTYQGNVPVIFDNNTNFTTTTEDMYFLNTNYLYLIEHPDARWTEQEKRSPVNQDASVTLLLWMGQMACDNRGLQGLLFDT